MARRLVRAQREQLEAVRRDVGPLPLLVAPYREREPVGLPALTLHGAELYGEQDPAAAPAPAPALLAVERTSDGFVLSLALPLARWQDLDLARSGDELVVTVAGRRRVLALPSALRRCVVAGAVLTHGRLAVRFEPDPALWMQP